MSAREELQTRTPLIESAVLEKPGGVPTLRAELSGDLTVVNAPELLSALRRLIDEHRITNAVLGFSEVGYVDSGALGALIEVRKTLGKNGGEVYLHEMPKELSGLIRIMKLDAVFQIGDAPGGTAPGPSEGSAEASA